MRVSGDNGQAPRFVVRARMRWFGRLGGHPDIMAGNPQLR